MNCCLTTVGLWGSIHAARRFILLDHESRRSLNFLERLQFARLHAWRRYRLHKKVCFVPSLTMSETSRPQIWRLTGSFSGGGTTSRPSWTCFILSIAEANPWEPYERFRLGYLDDAWAGTSPPSMHDLRTFIQVGLQQISIQVVHLLIDLVVFRCIEVKCLLSVAHQSGQAMGSDIVGKMLTDHWAGYWSPEPSVLPRCSGHFEIRLEHPEATLHSSNFAMFRPPGVRAFRRTSPVWSL